MSKYIKIANRKIGIDYVPLIIAEIGINHNGSLEVAKKMVDVAHGIGVEVIKHQTHIVDEEMTLKAREIIPGNSDCSIYDIINRCMLSENEEIELKKYVEKKGMIFLSTPFSFKAVDRLEKMGVVAYKIGSGEMNNSPLVEYIAQKKKTIILSTGMNDIVSIKKAVKCITKYHNEFAILHCTNVYPTPLNLVRLNAIEEIKENFKGEVFGLSDHSMSNDPAYAAMSMGASIIEKHFTDTRRRKGEDIICSMNPSDCRQILQFANNIHIMRGGKKELLKAENVTAKFAFNTVVAQKTIEKDCVITRDDVTTKRPNVLGIKAEDMEKVIGKVARRKIYSGEHIQWRDCK